MIRYFRTIENNACAKIRRAIRTLAVGKIRFRDPDESAYLAADPMGNVVLRAAQPLLGTSIPRGSLVEGSKYPNELNVQIHSHASLQSPSARRT